MPFVNKGLKCAANLFKSGILWGERVTQQFRFKWRVADTKMTRASALDKRWAIWKIELKVYKLHTQLLPKSKALIIFVAVSEWLSSKKCVPHSPYLLACTNNRFTFFWLITFFCQSKSVFSDPFSIISYISTEILIISVNNNCFWFNAWKIWHFETRYRCHNCAISGAFSSLVVVCLSIWGIGFI